MEFPKIFRRRAAIFRLNAGQLNPGVSIMGKWAAGPYFIAASILLLGWIVAGCDKNPLGTVESTGHPPFITTPSVNPDSVYIDALTPVAGSYTVPVTVSVRATHPGGQGSISIVTASFVRPGEIDPISQIQLLDDGTGPDIAAGDGIYSGTTQLSLYRPQAGTWRVQFVAVDVTGLKSNTGDIPLKLTIKNSAPSLGLPSLRAYQPAGSDSVRYSFAVAVSDSNGLETITSVSFRASGTTDTSAHQLFDDGIPAHGDAIPGDGIYSGIVWLKPAVSPDSVAFTISAVDDHGARTSVTHRVSSNRPPSFVAINVPSTITRPASGSIPINFFVTVTDPDGRADIDSVYFKNFSSSNPNNIFLMYDDGNLPVHGDSVAFDETYSLIIQIASTNTPGTKEFHFYVVDRSGASDTAVRNIVIN